MERAPGTGLPQSRLRFLACAVLLGCSSAASSDQASAALSAKQSSLGTFFARKLSSLEKKYDAQFRVVFEAIRELMTPVETPKKRPIGFASWEKKQR
ncbi:MAG: hypothetical protein ACREV9_05955 [Burkholderiales bacterium]